MKKSKILLALILPFLAFSGVIRVKANTFVEVTAGYGYTPVLNGTVGSRSWLSYNANNLVNYGYNLSDDNYYQIDEFNIRFRATGGFQRGTSYTVTFTWENFHPSIDTTNFYADWLLMTHSLYCYSSSWSSTGQTGSSCFNSSNISAANTGTTEINVTLTFVPSSDFYGLALVNQHGSTFTFYKSMGWEVFDIGYSYSTDGSQDIINNQNQNTQDIINNQDTNTQDIINNQNQNTQDIINNQNENNRVCNKKINGSSIYQRSVVLTTSGAESSAAASFGITDYIPIDKGIRVDKVYNYWIATCFYKQDKTLISCIQDSTMVKDTFLSIPNNAFYVRFSLHRTNGPELSICTNGNQAITDSITDDNTDGANSDAASFFNNFNTSNNGGISGIITAPLVAINRMLDNTCEPITGTYKNKTFSFPCGTDTWNRLSDLRSFLNLTEGGLLCYLIIRKLFLLIDSLKNPDEDRVEVMNL